MRSLLTFPAQLLIFLSTFLLAPIAARAQTLKVIDFFPVPSGFDAAFNQPIDVTVLSLYDTEARPFGAPDVTLVGATTGPVRGSLFIDPSATVITFVKTGAVLLPDIYTATLRSAANGFKDTAGNLLDGNDDDVAGGDFVINFEIPSMNAVTVSVPDFSFGPGQPINVPFDRVGLPLTLSNGAGVTTLDFTLIYDPALLSFERVERGGDLPADALGFFDLSIPGALLGQYDFPSGLPARPVEILRLIGFVPADAPYNRGNLIIFDTTLLNGGDIASMTDDAFHLVAYLGDTTGNGSYSALDGQRILRVASRLDSGFAAYPAVDPVIVGDTTWNGALSALDATRVLQEAAGIDRPEIPPIPTR